MRSTELCLLQTNQFLNSILNGKRAFIISSKINVIDGTCIKAKGRMRQATENPKKIPIFDFWQLDRKVNIYRDDEKFMNVRLSMGLPKDKNGGFTSINGKSTRFIESLKRTVVGLHNFGKIIKYAASKNSVVVFGSNDRIVSHGSCTLSS